ncbi:MAG: putative glycogen debranching enzyme [Cellvibrionaceae bacterium]|jgi:predicted glycogen debranching enzyme
MALRKKKTDVFVDLGREVCGRAGVSSNREWLVTNGIGGFAMGTVSGMLTRRYHGLLIAALNPPLGRTLMLTKFDETVQYDEKYYPLYIDRWFGDDEEEPGLTEPFGHFNLERFHLQGTTPVWTYAIADAILEKRIWMEQGENTTYIQYTLLRASEPMHLYPKAMVNYRDYHRTTIAEDLETDVEIIENGLKITMDEDATPLYLKISRGEIYPQQEWHEDYFYSKEEYRGAPDVVEDHLNIADFGVTLNPGETVTIVASTKEQPDLNGDAAFQRRVDHEEKLIAQAKRIQGELDPEMRQLVLAADQFIVERTQPASQNGHSIIAGYPWFSDWGRDTMISIPGLTLCSGREEIAKSILGTYAKYLNKGMLPNRFPDKGETPEYNTADASLWYFQSVRTYLEATGDTEFLKELYPVLQDILSWHQRGTRYSIHMDPADHLLYAGEEGVQLTWMDAKAGDWVVTPRIGKPIEINALWYNALRCMCHFSKQLGYSPAAFDDLATKVKESFSRFWYSPENYCYDVIDGPNGPETHLRPNQLLAISLSYSPLQPEQQKLVLDRCAKQLLTSHGLRSLAQDDPEYIGVYKGDVLERDGAYHQGTVWGWLIGPFIAAHLRVYKNPEMARSYLAPALAHLRDHGLGSISEIFDGDPPFTPRGCPAQAWSVAEYLRAWCMIHKLEEKGKQEAKKEE